MKNLYKVIFTVLQENAQKFWDKECCGDIYEDDDRGNRDCEYTGSITSSDFTFDDNRVEEYVIDLVQNDLIEDLYQVKEEEKIEFLRSQGVEIKDDDCIDDLLSEKLATMGKTIYDFCVKTEKNEAILLNFENKDYYKIKAVSASQLKEYSESPYRFWKSSIYNPNKIEKKSQALDFGKLVHCLLLEPQTFDDNFILCPFDNYKTKDSREWKEKQTKTIVKQSEVDKAILMVQKLKEHTVANSVLLGMITEKPYFMVDEKTGLILKGKLDGIKKLSDGTIVIMDYKSTSDIEGAIRYNYCGYQKYNIQDAVYKKLVRNRYPDCKKIKTVFVLQSKTDNEEDNIAVFSYSDDDCEKTNNYVNWLLKSLAKDFERYEKGDLTVWQSYPAEKRFVVSDRYWDEKNWENN